MQLICSLWDGWFRRGRSSETARQRMAWSSAGSYLCIHVCLVVICASSSSNSLLTSGSGDIEFSGNASGSGHAIMDQEQPYPTYPPFPPFFSNCPCGLLRPVHTMQYVPCYRVPPGPAVQGSTAITNPRQCDSFIFVATSLATRYIQAYSNHLPLFQDYCFYVWHLPPLYPNGQVNDSLLLWPLDYYLLQEDLPVMISELYKPYRRPLHGIIGPEDPRLSEIINHVVGKDIKRLIVSFVMLLLWNYTLKLEQCP